MIFNYVTSYNVRLSRYTMMDDKDGQSDIPDKLRFDIRAYASAALIRSLTVCLRHFAFCGRGQMASVRVHEYNESVSGGIRDAHQYAYTLSRVVATIL